MGIAGVARNVICTTMTGVTYSLQKIKPIVHDGMGVAACQAQLAANKGTSAVAQLGKSGVASVARASRTALRLAITLTELDRSLWGKKQILRIPMRRNQDHENCLICCDGIAPNGAVRLSCQHGWYCDSCMLKYTETQLGAGAVEITCPECRGPIDESSLRTIVPSSVIDRLLEQGLEQAVAAASDLFACPTPDCPMRVAFKDEDKPHFRCEICAKTSCLRCGLQPYHLNLTCEEAACGHTRSDVESDNGESSLLQWMAETGTKQCPKCRIPVSKENLDKQDSQRSECHKMWCRNCGTRFCFKCLLILTRTRTCKCTKAMHRFINPHTGKLVKDSHDKG